MVAKLFHAGVQEMFLKKYDYWFNNGLFPFQKVLIRLEF